MNNSIQEIQEDEIDLKELFNTNYDSTETFENLYPTTDIINKEFDREYTRVLFKNKLTTVKEINNETQKKI